MVSLEDIKRARKRIANIAKQTPLLSLKCLSEYAGIHFFLKSEHLQKTGSFKIRGALNKILIEKRKGVQSIVTASSGNHGAAVAYISNLLRLKAMVVVPENIAKSKRDAIEGYNGKIDVCGTTSFERIKRAIQISKENNAIYIPPYDDPLIIAGQGTVGLEILEQLDVLDEVYVPVGGGGLISGVAIAIKETKPTIRVIGVEPAIAHDTYLSFKAGKRMSVSSASKTIADGLRTSIPGELTFPIIQRYVDDMVLVDEHEIIQAFIFILKMMKQVIEPSAAVAVAAAMKSKNKFVAAIASGGNIDTSTMSFLINKD